MRPNQSLIASLVAVAAGMGATAPSCPPFPSSMVEFSASFKQPEPPLIQPEYRTNFVQHKWNQNLSHITTGFINNSPSKGFVQVDEAFATDNGAGGRLASSYFNYANVTKEGLVDNTLTTYSGNSTKPDVFRGYVDSNFPIFEKDLLVKSGAVFGGLVQRQFAENNVAAWNIMYQGVIPVTIFVNNCNVMVGYNYFSPRLRTRVVTEYFNIQVGAASA
ncbi:hypothetical protein LMH87_006114 [Akanthomyces muscarius]|uniref:Uncharacterized protein n=1 Tax=Akanthomyces muscarius TaxID=2231603 RepID=A0A9W8USP6_AKAMU|nr:hypothetical protein LMH87_006114 [Akanthomyces muscarius]KAJ4164438.1 hypothetical protein LMH87_006114 [Akanthomyces muscarius]